MPALMYQTKRVHDLLIFHVYCDLMKLRIFLSQFTFQHRTTILLKVKLVFSSSQKKKQKTKQFDAKIFIFSSHNYLNQDLYCATKIETYISDIVSVKLPFFSQNLNSFFLNGSCKDLL